MPAGNTAVVSIPSTTGNYGQVTNTPAPLSDYSSIYSSFTENMNATGRTSAEAAYDIWLGQNSSSRWSSEVMIQHDIVNRGTCPVLATATFGGSGGVPVHNWNLCRNQSELIRQRRAVRQRGHPVHAHLARRPRVRASGKRSVADRLRLRALQHGRDEREFPGQQLLDNPGPFQQRQSQPVTILASIHRANRGSPGRVYAEGAL